jgi:hypothetical protein
MKLLYFLLLPVFAYSQPSFKRIELELIGTRIIADQTYIHISDFPVIRANFCGCGNNILDLTWTTAKSIFYITRYNGDLYFVKEDKRTHQFIMEFPILNYKIISIK